MNLSKPYVGAILIAIAGFVSWGFALPLYDNITGANDVLAQYNDLLKNRESIIDRIDTLSEQVASKTDELKNFSFMVPAKKNSPELVSAMQALATSNGLSVTSMALTASQVQDKSPYNIQSIDMGLMGPYLGFRSFLSALESNIRIVDIISVDASPVGESTTIIGFRIKANAYFLK